MIYSVRLYTLDRSPRRGIEVKLPISKKGHLIDVIDRFLGLRDLKDELKRRPNGSNHTSPEPAQCIDFEYITEDPSSPIGEHVSARLVPTDDEGVKILRGIAEALGILRNHDIVVGSYNANRFKAYR